MVGEIWPNKKRDADKSYSEPKPRRVQQLRHLYGESKANHYDEPANDFGIQIQVVIKFASMANSPHYEPDVGDGSPNSGSGKAGLLRARYISQVLPPNRAHHSRERRYRRTYWNYQNRGGWPRCGLDFRRRNHGESIPVRLPLE
jgi:hypothetical protein